MALNRDKFRKIVGGITTSETEQAAAGESSKSAESEAGPAYPPSASPAGQGPNSSKQKDLSEEADTADHRRFAKRGRPKGQKAGEPSGKGRKVKVSLFLSECIINDLYDWAHADKIHPGEMFERALKPFHERETKRRNSGKE